LARDVWHVVCQWYIGFGGQLARQGLHLSHYRSGESARSSRAGAIAQTAHAMPAEAVSPLAKGVITDTQGTPNCGIGHAVGGGQHNPGTHHVAMLPAGFTRPGQQHLPLRIGKHYGIATRQRHTAFVARAESVLSATRRATIMNTVPTPPESTKTSLR
jgi:hypothetical protein